MTRYLCQYIKLSIWLSLKEPLPLLNPQRRSSGEVRDNARYFILQSWDDIQKKKKKKRACCSPNVDLMMLCKCLTAAAV